MGFKLGTEKGLEVTSGEIKTKMRFNNIVWGNEGLALVYEGLRSKQVAGINRFNPITGDLERIFTNHEEAKEFFTSLSISNQKEYLSWIQGAKKAETRQIRLETAVEKLMAGKRNPTEK